MIKRFIKVNDKLYRGSAPSINDVKMLKHKYKINKIISLDRACGHRINNICEDLGIEHVVLPLDGTRKSLLALMNHNIYNLLVDNAPTYVHCAEGKDRTGFLIALFKCMYMGYSYEDAIEEAEALGFGIGVPPHIIDTFKQIIQKACNLKNKKNDENMADVVDNQRSYKDLDDGRGSYLSDATQGSIAPFISKTRQYPYDNPYNSLYSQSPTRENYQAINPHIDYEENSVDMPLVGIYNNMAGIIGVGPSLNVGGFIND